MVHMFCFDFMVIVDGLQINLVEFKSKNTCISVLKWFFFHRLDNDSNVLSVTCRISINGAITLVSSSCFVLSSSTLNLVMASWKYTLAAQAASIIWLTCKTRRMFSICPKELTNHIFFVLHEGQHTCLTGSGISRSVENEMSQMAVL